MALVDIISKLSSAEGAEKQKHYISIVKLFSENTEIDSASDGLNNKHIKTLCCSIIDDLNKEVLELPHLVKVMQLVFHNKYLQKFFPESEKNETVKNIISIVDSCQHENVLVNCFSVLIQISPFILENTELNDLLQRMEEILSKKNDAASTYSICCYFQRFIKDYEEKLFNFIPVLSKLVFLPLCHPSTKVREVAEKTLDMFPKLLLYTSDEEACGYLVKLVKETYSRSLLLLFKEKQELYALKVWKHIVNALGNALHTNLPGIMPFFSVLEKGFKSSNDEICIASFIAWKSLINSFAVSEGVLNDSKILRFTLKPFKNVSRLNENVISVVCDTWYHLAWNLSDHLSNRFSEVCIPLLELTVGKITNGISEKTFPKGGASKSIKKGCYILLRFLEQPPSESFNRLSSPKKLPNIPYPALQIPLDVKIITHHFKEILNAMKIIIDVCGTREDMKLYLDSLMKSVLFIVSSVIEDSNKESIEAVTQYLIFLSNIIEAKTYPSLLCLKCFESLSKLSRKILVSHCFNGGSRKSQDILCTSLLKLLLNPHLFPSEAPKRFFAAYNRLVQAGIYESFHALSITYKLMHVIRNANGVNSLDVEMLIDMWSGVATPLLEVIEKTQEVNQGDKQEHDFSCMYDVLLFPFEFIFPVYIHQFRARPAFKLWTNLYKSFIRSASLVTTTSTNEACENFCCKLKEHLKEDLLKKPHFFETVCVFTQTVLDSIDFSSGATSNNQGVMDIALMAKRKKPLGNLTSFVDILSVVLKAYYDHYIEEDDSNLSSPPAIQRKLHIVKSAAPLDILKTFFGNLKVGGIISLVLEQLVDPISKLFFKSSQKRNLVNHIDSKLEIVWNVLSSCIERYYIGPYDSEFLTILSPLLEATFSHPKRHLKEKSRRFWFATFGPNTSSLQFPDSLKTVLKKMKLPLLPDDISPTEFSISPMHESISEDSLMINTPATSTLVTVKSQIFKSPMPVNGEASKVVPKDNKQSPKISIDDLPSQEFVKIDSPIVTTPRRRNIRKRKSYVPSLYNDLSQDTATLMSSSESQDTQNSAPLEEIDLKESAMETEEPSTEHVNSVSTVQKDDLNISKTGFKSLMAAKFEEKLNKSVENESIPMAQNKIITISLSDSDSESDIKKKVQKNSANTNDVMANSNELSEKISKTEILSEKISVFSEPGEKQIKSRNTRRNTRLSQSFSGASTSKDSEKLEIKKLNKSCSELIHISDSEEIIPSSQDSSENENSIKLSVSKNKNLYVENDNQKSLTIDNSNKNIELQLPVCCLSGQENIDKEGKNNLNEKNFHIKVISSTPSKSKSVVIKDCEKLQEKSFKEIKGTVTISTLVKSQDKVETVNVDELLTKKPEKITIKPSIDKPVDSEIKDSTKEVIKDLNFLLDAVDHMVESSPAESEQAPCIESSPPLNPDVEMEDLSSAENRIAISDTPEDKTNVVKQHDIKKARLNLKLLGSNSSQNEMYSQRLRKKTPLVIVKTNLKRKKSILKTSNSKDTENAQSEDTILSNINEDVKNSEKAVNSEIENTQSEIKSGRRTNNSKKRGKTIVNITESLREENILLEENSSSKSDTNLNNNTKDNKVDKDNIPLHRNENLQQEISKSSQEDDLQNKVSCKDSEGKNEKSEVDIVKNEHSEKSSFALATKGNADKEKSNGNLNDNSNNSRPDEEAVEYSESGEIFEALSENSCKDLHNEDVFDETPLPDSEKLDGAELFRKESESNNESQVIVEYHNPLKSSDKISHISASNINDDLKDINKKFPDNINIIPCSLDNDNSLDASNRISNLSENLNSARKDTGMLVTIKLSNLAQFSSTVQSAVATQNSKITSEPLSVQFSDTEDDVSLDMRNIVSSIIDASCESSENILSEESKDVKSLLLSRDSDVIDKDHDTKSAEASKEVLSQLSEDGSSSGVSYSSGSSDEIISGFSGDIIENSTEILDKSDEMVMENTNSNMENDASTPCYENIIDPKTETDEILVSETHNETYVSKIDHCYSVPEKNSDQLEDSHANESCNIIKNNIRIDAQSLQIEGTDMKSCEIKESIKLSGEKKIMMSEINNVIPDAGKSSSNSNELVNIEVTNSVVSDISTSGIITTVSVSDENEIKRLIKELIIQVESIDNTLINLEIENSFISNSKYSFKTVSEDGESNSQHTADKENQLIATSINDENLARGSKKRKIKPPIRSPFNFRQRGKGEISKKICTKGIQSLNISQMKSATEDKELICKTVFPKAEMKDEENAENSMVKIMSSIVDSITEDDSLNSEILPSVPSSSQMTKAQRIELSNDELTDLNTRLNASLAPQTRRSKMFVASHKTSTDTEIESTHSDVEIVCSENSSGSLSSILKKRKSSGSLPQAKIRKVTFASPLIHEVVIESCSEARGIEIVNMNRIQNLTKKRKKILQEKNKTDKPPVHLPVPIETEDVPSSSEYQDSDVLAFSDLPVSPALINCPDDVSNILKDLTSPSWVRGLESLLASKNIKTIGDVCKLNIHQVKALPFKSPKVFTLHKALMAYINVTQDATLEKFKTIDDGSFVMDTVAASSSFSENTEISKSEISDEDESKLLEETLKDIVSKGQLKELPLSLLGQFVEACGKAILEKSEQNS